MWVFRKLPIRAAGGGRRARPAFTLVEVLIATSVLAIAGGLVTGLFSTIMRHKDSSSASQMLADDGRIMLMQIARDIQTNTVDYDEYYNEALYGKNEATGKPFPGQRFGEYASRFYVSTDQAKNKDCSKDVTSCISVSTNPPDNVFVHTANAFRQAGTTTAADLLCDNDGNSTVSGFNIECVKRLFLISGDGYTRTFFARKLVSYPVSQKNTYVLSKVVLSRSDKDEKNMPFGFWCDILYCPKPIKITISALKNPKKNENLSIPIPNMEALTQGGNGGIASAYASDFLPLSPSRTNIIDMQFYISPVEDPNKGFGEDSLIAAASERISHQPFVTIVLKVEPASNQLSGTKFPSLTLYKTVVPGVSGDVLSYPPVVDIIK